MIMHLRPLWVDMGICSYWQLMAVWFMVAALTGCTASGPSNPRVPRGANSSGGKHARIETEVGNITIQFYEDDSPTAVDNFRLLAEHGYFDGLTFHRVVEGFMIQGGDPRGDGTGGESAWGGSFDDEIDRDSALYRRGYRRGIVAMANSGPDTNGSQFFIMHGIFFDRYFSEPTFILDLKIIRVQRPGRSTGIHSDVVYMGRGTKRLCSCWIPLGDISVEQGPLALCAGSNSLLGFAKLRETYGHYDVDRTLMRGANGSFSGWFSFDLTEITERFGGRWRTANYRAGDVLVFTPYTMHCGLDNNSGRYRLSSDIRCQPLAEPADPRWIGGNAPGNTKAHQLHRNEIEAQTTFEEARKEWGV